MRAATVLAAKKPTNIRQADVDAVKKLRARRRLKKAVTF
jgi:hypothetical protein